MSRFVVDNEVVVVRACYAIARLTGKRKDMRCLQVGVREYGVNRPSESSVGVSIDEVGMGGEEMNRCRRVEEGNCFGVRGKGRKV